MDLAAVTPTEAVHFYRLLAFGLSLFVIPIPWILRIGLALAWSLFGLPANAPLAGAWAALYSAVPFAVLARELICGFAFGMAFCALIFAAQFLARALNEMLWRRTLRPLSGSLLEISLIVALALLMFEPGFLLPFFKLLFHQSDPGGEWLRQLLTLGGQTLQFSVLLLLPFFAVFFCVQALSIGLQRMLSTEVDYELVWTVSVPLCVLVLMLSLQPLEHFARLEQQQVLEVVGPLHE